MARGSGLSFAAALAATLLMAGPVVLEPEQRIFGSSRTFALDDPNRDALVVIEQFRTGQVPGPYLQPLTDLPGRALAWIVGPVTAYNMLVLASFPLSAAAAYLLARDVLGSHLGAMVAGLAYAFLPFHVAHASQHAQVAQTQWLPLYFLALWRCLDRPDLRRGWLLLAAVAAVALSNFYAGFIAAVLSPVALVAYGVVSPRQPGEPRWKRVALTGLILAAALSAGLLGVHSLAPAVLVRPGAFAFPRSDLFLHSAKWWSFLVPALDHPLAGARVRELWAGSGLEKALLEQQVSVGWSILVLGAVPLGLWLSGDRASLATRSAPVLASVAMAALLCSLSPERRIGFFTFVRPSAWLYEVAPMFRAYARFGVVVGLMTALLAGGGVACLWRRPGSASRAVVSLLVGLAVLEYAPFPPWRWRDALPTSAHRWLANQSGALRVLDCVPPSRVSDSLAIPLLGHPVSLLGEPPFDDCGEPQLADKLRAMGYTHVLLRRDSPIGTWLAAAIQPRREPPDAEGAGAQPRSGVSPRGPSDGIHSRREPPDEYAQGLRPGPQFPDARVLEVTAELPPAYVSSLRGFSPREYDARATWRWMAQTGSLRVAATRESAENSLELELKAFPQDRRIEWFLDGRRLGELEVTTEWRRYTLPLGPLSPGGTTLTLACPGPAVVANDVLHNGDSRSLGLAVGDWRLQDSRQTRQPGRNGR